MKEQKALALDEVEVEILPEVTSEKKTWSCSRTGREKESMKPSAHRINT